MIGANFDEVYKTPACNQPTPKCSAPYCFISSYPPVSKPGENGPFFVNTSFLQPNRYAETVRAVPVRSEDFKCN